MENGTKPCDLGRIGNFVYFFERVEYDHCRLDRLAPFGIGFAPSDYEVPLLDQMSVVPSSLLNRFSCRSSCVTKDGGTTIEVDTRRTLY